jgi:hypothetical protein
VDYLRLPVATGTAHWKGVAHNVRDPEKGHPRARAVPDGQWEIEITRSRALGGVWFLDQL